MKKLIINIFIFSVLITFPWLVNASPGELDFTFNSTGKVTTIFDTVSVPQAVAIQADDKIVVAGISYNTTNYDYSFSVARFNTNGSLDTTFDTDGKVSTSLGVGGEVAYAVAIQADGKIIVVGAGPNNNAVAAVRYNADGSLDNSFDSDGIVTTPCGGNFCNALSVAIQNDGKILVTGVGSAPNINHFFSTIRYNSDGSLDSSFDFDGIAEQTFGTISSNGRKIAVHPNGKIYVGGQSDVNSTGADFTIISYNQDGSLNTDFDSDGIVTTDFGNSSDNLNSIEIQPDGKILLGGLRIDSNGFSFILARYNLDGSLDTSFDSDGILITNDSISDITIQSDGKILTTGSFNNGTNYDFLTVRYNSDGTLDNSFSVNRKFWANGGKSTVDFSNTDDDAKGVKVDSQGRVVIVGGTWNPNQMFGVARLQNLAPTAANASIKGRVLTKFGRGISNAEITLQSDVSNEIKTVRTNSFGYYNFDDLQSGKNYILTINSKRYRFSQSSIFISLNEDFTEANFIAE
jgi:uncharacterized delta-60 repeat protein